MTEEEKTSAKFSYTILYVLDVERTVDFYQRAFDIKKRMIHESRQYAELETGPTALAFAHESMHPARDAHPPNSAENKAVGVEIAFVVKDVAAAFRRAVDAGAIPVEEPAEKPWGQTVSYVRDLNGFLVELCTEVRG